MYMNKAGKIMRGFFLNWDSWEKALRNALVPGNVTV